MASASTFSPEFRGLARLARRSGYEPRAVEVLTGDVGRRRYARLELGDGRTVLGVVYPNDELDSCRRWLAAREVLAGCVRVPELIADDGAGTHIIEDLGRTDLSQRLIEEPSFRREGLSRAVAAAGAIAATPDPGVNPPFEAAFFRRELELAREAVFDRWLAAPLSDAERRAHDVWADALCAEIAGHPRALCHRDFHGNNLFPTRDGVAAIDFQDLRSGPDSYDLASLLWERTTLEWMTPPLATGAVERHADARGTTSGELLRRLDRVLLQRAWKVCGTFARTVAEGRGQAYRRYLPAEIALVGRLLTSSSEDAAFRGVFASRLAPLC